MKTQTMFIIGAAVVGAYFALKASAPTQNKKMSVLNRGGAQTVDVDANMTDDEITQFSTTWNKAFENDDITAAQQVINGLSAANHPIAAANLQKILSSALAQANAANPTPTTTAGYSAGRGSYNMAGRLHRMRAPLMRDR